MLDSWILYGDPSRDKRCTIINDPRTTARGLASPVSLMRASQIVQQAIGRLAWWALHRKRATCLANLERLHAGLCEQFVQRGDLGARPATRAVGEDDTLLGARERDEETGSRFHLIG